MIGPLTPRPAGEEYDHPTTREGSVNVTRATRVLAVVCIGVAAYAPVERLRFAGG